MRLEGKNIVITGGGRGIGRTVAQRCVDEGAVVFLIARTFAELEETSESIRRAGGTAYFHACDVSDPDQVKRAFVAASSNCGQIDVLVNNAGVQPPIGPFAETDSTIWVRNLEINLLGTAYCTKAILPEMIARRGGKIINVSGGGSTSPRPNFSAYGVSKTALVRFTETLAAEVQGYNIGVNAISPGAVNTRMLDEVLSSGDLAGEEKVAAEKRKGNGGDDPGTAADLVAFLGSDDSNGITGKLISAKWDPWKQVWFQNRLRSDKDFATLRRIDARYFDRKENLDNNN